MNRIYHILFLLGLVVAIYPQIASPQQLEIHCIDVGQGSSEFIIGPNGTTILIDGGTRSKGEDEVIPYLDALFSPDTASIDYIIATHDDRDHYGGLNYIIDYSGYSIGTIYHCGDNTDFGEGVQISLGTVIDLGDGARATCVGRYGEFIDGSSGSTGSNNLSVCLLIEYGGFDYVTAGDLEGNEDELSTALIGYPPADPYLNPAYGADAIHVNHHGSNGSSHNYYINRLIPEVALINGGTSYGHPRWTTVDRLKGRTHYTIDCSCIPDMCGDPTGVTVPGAAVFRTTADSGDCKRASELDCPTLGDIVVTYDGCAENYYVEGKPYPVDEWIICTTPSPTPEGYHTPSPTPSLPPTPSPTLTQTPTPSVTPTPEGYRTPTPTPSTTPTPSSTPTSSPSPTPPSAAFPFYDGFEAGEFGQHWSIMTETEGRVEVSVDYPYAGVHSALLDDSYSNGTYSTAGLILTINLSTQTDVDLAFQWREFNDENHAQDGVFISDDYGSDWSQLTSFNNGPTEFTGAVIDLTAGAAAAGLDLNDHFQVKFQMYDNFSIPTDGYAIDDVRIWRLVTPTPSPTPSPTPEGYHTPSPTPSLPPTPSPTSTRTPTPSPTSTPTLTPSVSPTPEGYHTPTPTPPPKAVYVFNLDSDPGWSKDGDWDFGQPSGGGGEHGNPDPSSGFGTGTNVYGYNLSGDYTNDLTPTRWLTSSEIDCSQITDTTLKFERWLNVESRHYDHAYLEASSNGFSWVELWANPASETEDSSWLEYTYDVSAIADGRSLYLRWGMGITDRSWSYSGWNIDDIEIWGFWHTTPTPTSSPTPSVTPTVTPTPSVTPSPTAVGYKTPTPIPTLTPPLPPPTPSPTSMPTPLPTSTPVLSPTLTPLKPTPSPTCGPIVPPANIVFESGDFDGDDTDDIAIFRASIGMWAVRGVTRSYFGRWNDSPIPGDYDGDGTSDISIFRDEIGLWAIQGVTRVYFGGTGDIPSPNDYDGDSSTDIAIFRGSTGLWALRGLSRAYFGAGGDWPIPGDYSGDGTSSIAVFRPSSGLWAIRGRTRIYFGADGDWALPGDYVGSGTCNPAIFRACTGLWAIRGVTRSYHGRCTDYPIRADFDGTGIDSIGIFRSEIGLWAIGGISRVYFGADGDIPVTR